MDKITIQTVISIIAAFISLSTVIVSIYSCLSISDVSTLFRLQPFV